MIKKVDAMDYCIAQGEKYIYLFDLFYRTQDKKILNEMNHILNNVKNLVIEETQDKILLINLIDWFFTAGNNPDDLINNCEYIELKAYDEFIKKIIIYIYKIGK